MGLIKRTLVLFRSAVTGRFVTRDYASKHQDTTIREKRDK